MLKLALRRSFPLLILTGLLLTACSDRILRVSPINDSRPPKGRGIVYHLPQTTLQLEFQIVCTRHTPGPYALYAPQFLGIENSLEQPSKQYEIRAIRIATRVEADPAHPFFAHLKEQAPPAFATLTQNGLIVPIQGPIWPTAKPKEILENRQQPAYLDLSTQPFIADQQNIFFSVIKQDSAFVRIPVQRSVIVKRSLEEKARQAADLIFNLRKKRVDLVTGEVELPNAPDALPAMLHTIDQLEATYLQLFIGQTRSDTITVQIDYTPRPDELTAIPCRYSPTEGILDPASISATPLVLNLTPESPIAQDSTLRAINNAYYTRSANPTLLELSLNGESLFKGRLPILQFGPVRQIPIFKPKKVPQPKKHDPWPDYPMACPTNH